MTSAALVGGTGLVGSHILTTLLAHPTITSIHALTRRTLPSSSSPKLHPLTSPDTTTWSSLLSATTPPPQILISALGTTRAQAGSIEAQRKIDYDLNLSLASTFSTNPKDENEDGKQKIYILISTSGANSSSMIPYSRMKGELEDSIISLSTSHPDAFKHIIILRPGLIVGSREDSRPSEFAMRKIAGIMGALHSGLKDFWAQDAQVIARAAVNAGLRALEGKDGEREIPKVWELGMADIVRLGRTEWKE